MNMILAQNDSFYFNHYLRTYSEMIILLISMLLYNLSMQSCMHPFYVCT